MTKAEITRDMVFKNVTITIATSTTVSDAFATGGKAIFGLVVPSTFDGTTITFQVSADGVTYQALYDITNTAVGMTIAASRSYDLPTQLAAWPYFKIVCGSAQTTTNTIFVVVAKG